MGFVRNTWYCAAWSESLTDTPLHRKFLGEEVVLYRKAFREPVALSNRCPHRFAPLHKGQLKGDAIECPYHGLRFGPSGACVHNPHGDGRIPQAAQVCRKCGADLGLTASVRHGAAGVPRATVEIRSAARRGLEIRVTGKACGITNARFSKPRAMHTEARRRGWRGSGPLSGRAVRPGMRLQLTRTCGSAPCSAFGSLAP